MRKHKWYSKIKTKNSTQNTLRINWKRDSMCISWGLRVQMRFVSPNSGRLNTKQSRVACKHTIPPLVGDAGV